MVVLNDVQRTWHMNQLSEKFDDRELTAIIAIEKGNSAFDSCKAVSDENTLSIIQR